MRIRILLLSLFFCFPLGVMAQDYYVLGKVTNVNNTPVTYASIRIENTTAGTITNEKGDYRLKLPAGNYILICRVMGYPPERYPLKLNDRDSILNIKLKLTPLRQEVYPKDSALAIVRELIARRKDIRKETPTYSNEVYSKSVQRLIDAPKMFFKKDISKKLNLDTNRQGIISLTESISQFNFKQPDKIKQITEAAKLSPYNSVFNFNTALDVQVDLSRNFLRWNGMSHHSFISPIATNAFRFYDYKLIKRYRDGDLLINAIEIFPKHYDEHLFSGIIYVVDRTWNLYAVDLHLYPSAHIDFIDSIGIKQQYTEVKKDSWLPQSLKFSYNGGVLGFKYGGYFLNVYNNFNTDTTFAHDYFNNEVLHTDKEAYLRDEGFWAKNRLVPLTREESFYYHINKPAENVSSHVTDSLQRTNNRFKFVDFIFDGYTLHNRRRNASWSFPGPYRVFFFNTIEGFGFDLNVRYNRTYPNHRILSVAPEVRYGSIDRVFNANVGVTYFYNPFKQATIYGNIGSNYLDLNNNGTVSPFLNSLSTLLLGNNYIKLYQSKFIILGTDGEVANGVLLNGQMEYSDRRSLVNSTTGILNKADSINLTSNNPLVEGNLNTPLFPANRALIFKASATFTFNQEYEINPDGKFIRYSKYPRIRINYRRGLPLFDSEVDYNFASVDIFQDRLHMGIVGYSSYFLSAGAFLNNKNAFYVDFNQFKGGQSVFFDPTIGSFHFLNFYKYSTYKPYFEAHLEHNFAGLFTSRIPLLNNLNLQEIVGGSFLTQGLLPDYKEFYIGVRRTVFRLDYGFAFSKYSTPRSFRFIYNL